MPIARPARLWSESWGSSLRPSSSSSSSRSSVTTLSSSSPKSRAPSLQSLKQRRKTVTVLFVGIVDFMNLAAALDPEVLRSIMRRYFDTVRTIVERHGGTVEKFIGDTAMAVFGVPLMHEDDALRAVRSAKDLGDALVSLNADLERDQGLTLQIRTGISTGEVLVGDAASGQPVATGPAVTVAMQLQQSALPGETLLGDAARAVLHEAAVLEPVEQIETDPPLGPIRAFRLLGVGEHAGVRPQSSAPFVGRLEELAALRLVFDAARAERRSRVVTVLGEAGVGKTRLISEFASSLGAEATVLVGRCVSYGEGATYLPLAEIVRQVAPERPQATIAALLEGDENAALIAERVAELAGLGEGAAQTGELFWAVRRFLESLARDATGGRRPRRRPLGRADATRPDRVPRRLDLRGAGPGALPRETRAPGQAARLADADGDDPTCTTLERRERGPPRGAGSGGGAFRAHAHEDPRGGRG